MFFSNAGRAPSTGQVSPSSCTCCGGTQIIIGGGATNRGVETSVREAFNLDLASIVVRECCWSSDAAAHYYSLDKAMKMYARIRSLDQVTAMLRE
jgi:nicotinamidase-related amidase